MSEGATVEVRGVGRAFAGRAALSRVSLTFAPGRYTCVMGPSGSGKSTLLRLIAGHDRPDAGSIHLDGRDITAEPPERRPVHTVFQDRALFPRMSVLDNVAFAGRARGLARQRRRAIAADRLREVGLDPERFADRRPATLSGGEAQRVALARALFDIPEVLLLDEPSSALDHHLRLGLRRRLAALQRERGLTFIHVTHDADEAMALADELVVLVDGEVAAQGTPADLHRRPPSRAVAQLLGEVCELPGGVSLRPGALRLRTDAAGRLPATERARRPVADSVEVCLEVGGVVVWVRGSAPSETVRSVDWDPADVFEFAP